MTPMTPATVPSFNDNDNNEDNEDEESSLEDSNVSSVSSEGDEKDQDYYLQDHYDEDALPEYACRYCGIHDPACVAKCVESQKWFCNGSGNKGGSHLVHHLVKSRSHQVQLHPESPLGDTTLECYNCGSRNVFVLGFVPASESTVVVLLCRVCVETVPALKDMEWELSAWHPLIQDRRFLPWLVKVPSDDLLMRARAINYQEMMQLEDLWKTRQDAMYRDLHAVDILEEDMEPVLPRYDDGYHYQNVHAPLVKIEADYDRQIKEALTEESVRVRWDKSLSGKWLAFFSFRRMQIEQTKIVIGDELRLKISHGNEFLFGKPWEGTGYVKSIIDGEVELEMRSVATVPEQITEDYTVEFIWKATTFDRMQHALTQFAIDDKSVTGYIYHKLLGHDVEEQHIPDVKLPKNREDFKAPGLPQLNESQIEAVEMVLQRPLSLIQGPPGTGKTVTCATLTYHLTQQNMGRVLVTAPSNVAVDHLTEKIAATGLRVVRIASKTREQTSSSVDHLCLHVQVPQVAGEQYQKLAQLKDVMGDLREQDLKRFNSLRNKAESDILHAADVICCTCVGAGDPRLKKFRFRQVLIDEATQGIEAETLIPMVMGAKQVIFVGDHCQLGPVVMNKAAAKAGLTTSMFERLVLNGNRPIRLQIQYRMHPVLSEWPSNMFYEGSLQNGVTAVDRQLLNLASFEGSEDFPWPIADKPMFFYSVHGMEEISASGTSYLNRTEASYVEKCVTHLLKMGVRPLQIGVITPYDGQRKYVSDHMRRVGSLQANLYEEIEVASVDAFQGREKDFILVSCVRSSESQGIGFLSDPRRLNVALTRARLGLILVGNPRVLSKNALWYTLLVHFRDNGCLVEGTLNNLKPTYVALSKPKRSIADGDRYAFTALARGAWDGREQDRRTGSSRTAPAFRSLGKKGDSRYDNRYKNAASFSSPTTGVPIPSFAPLPNYGGDDLSSVGGDSDFGAASRTSLYSQRSSARAPNLMGYTVGVSK